MPFRGNLAKVSKAIAAAARKTEQLQKPSEWKSLGSAGISLSCAIPGGPGQETAVYPSLVLYLALHSFTPPQKTCDQT